jgi:hypothetical protein
VSDLADRVAALVAAGDDQSALDLAERAVDENPHDRDAHEVLLDVLSGTGNHDEGVRRTEAAVDANPDELWPLHLFADACERAFPGDDGAIASAVAAVKAAPSVPRAMTEVRHLLRKAHRWMELSRHLERMIGATNLIGEQVELHDELADVVATRLSDPLAARDIRLRGDKFRDVPGLVTTYWSAIEAGDPEVLGEASDFFRSNELFSDLAALLEKRIEGRSPSEVADVADELVSAYSELPDADWKPLIARLKQAREGADTATSAKLGSAIARAEKNRRGSTTSRIIAAALPKSTKSSVGPVVFALAAAALGIGIVVIVYLNWFR